MTPDAIWNLVYLLIVKLIKLSFSKEAFSSILVLISSLATLILTNRNNNKQNDKQREFQIQQSELQSKENFINVSIENRISAYSDLFDALKDLDAYFFSFIAKQDNFKESKEENEFAPLLHVEKLRKIYSQKELWLSKDLQNSVTDLFQLSRRGLELAEEIALAQIRGVESEDTSYVEGYCVDMLKKIEEVNEIIREDLGLSYIQEYQERLRNVKFN